MPDITQLGTTPKADRPPDEDVLLRLSAWKNESERDRRQHEHRWAKNLRLIKGQLPDNESPTSRVRNRSKLFFRKIWSMNWRLVASFYAAFLRDEDEVRVEGRGPEDVWPQAGVLQKMVEYRRDYLRRAKDFFLQLVWGFRDITDLGIGIAVGRWEYETDESGMVVTDGPDIRIIPPERCLLDLSARTKHQMRFFMWEEYLTKDDLRAERYDNLDQAVPMTPTLSQVAAARQPYATAEVFKSEHQYPSPGSVGETERKDLGAKYRVIPAFYKYDGKIMFCVWDGDKVIYKKPIPSPYGRHFPIALGLCLAEPHQLIGEGFPESNESPQESINAGINARKDNAALALNRGTIVGRFAGVDLQSLMNSRPGGITLADDPTQVIERQIMDVTQSSYAEVAADEAMMEEMSGVTPPLLGQENTTKATVAQINISQSNAKIELYLAIVGETFMREIYWLLAYLIQQFETDARVFRIANESFRKQVGQPGLPDVLNVDDFEADVIVKVGPGAVNRQAETQNLFLAMDRAIMSNNQMATLAKAGVMPPEGLDIFNTVAFMEEILPKLGIKNPQRFKMRIAPPAQPGGQDPSVAGSSVPQIGLGAGSLPVENALQAGGLGGM